MTMGNWYKCVRISQTTFSYRDRANAHAEGALSQEAMGIGG